MNKKNSSRRSYIKCTEKEYKEHNQKIKIKEDDDDESA